MGHDCRSVERRDQYDEIRANLQRCQETKARVQHVRREGHVCESLVGGNRLWPRYLDDETGVVLYRFARGLHRKIGF